MKKGHDSRCYDLAEIFLIEHPPLHGRESELAQHIQDEIEGWIEFELHKLRERNEGAA